MFEIDISQLESLVDDLEHDMNLLMSIQDDPKFIVDLTEIISTNFEEVFGSNGGVIKEDWDGHDLVDTGTLRASLTSPGLIGVTFTSNGIIFESNIEYAKYLNDDYTFYGIASTTDERISQLVGKFLKEKGRLNYV